MADKNADVTTMTDAELAAERRALFGYTEVAKVQRSYAVCNEITRRTLADTDAPPVILLVADVPAPGEPTIWRDPFQVLRDAMDAHDTAPPWNYPVPVELDEVLTAARALLTFVRR